MLQLNPPRASTFAADVIKLITGTTTAQLIVIISSPILTRLYGPELFGFLALFTSIVSIVGVIACMRYELSIILPESDEEAAHVFWLCILIDVIVSVLTFPIVLYRGNVTALLNAPNLEQYLWLVPIAVFVSGSLLSLNSWNSRSKRFSRLAMARVTSAIVTSGSQVGSGLLGFATTGNLIGSYLGGQGIMSVLLGWQTYREDGKFLRNNFSFRGIVHGLKRYKRFPLMDTGSALLNAVSWQLPAFLLAVFFSPIVVGFYALGFRILKTPMNLIGTSISQVFFQRAADARREGTLDILVENVFGLLVLLGLFPILLVTIVGGDLFTIVFGDIWGEAGLYAQILGIWTFVWFISSPLSTLYIVLEKQDFGLLLNIANFITRIISLVVGGLLGSVYIALGLFAISGIFVYGYLCYTMLKFSGVRWYVIKSVILSNVILFFPAGIILIVIKIIYPIPILSVSVALMIGLLYYGYLIKRDVHVRGILKHFGLNRVHHLFR